MSASSKKKLRKEQNAAAMTEKQLNEQKEAKKLKAYSALFIGAMVLVLCIAVGVLIGTAYTTSGAAERNTVAVTINDHVLSNADLAYFYVDTVNSTYEDWYNTYSSYTDIYVQMMGLDLTQPLDEQAYPSDTSMTWADYFIDLAVQDATSTYALYDLAVAEGRTLTEDELASIQTNIDYLETMATLYGYEDLESYLTAFYGYGASVESYRTYGEISYLANAYYNEYADSLTYTDDEIRAYEADAYDNYSSFNYARYYLGYTSFLEGGTTDEEGNTTYSDEEKAAALEAAKATAEQLAECTSLEELDAAIAALPINEGTEAATTKHEDEMYTDLLSMTQDWLADPSRQEGDTTVVANENYSNEDGEELQYTTFGYYVIYFESRNDNEMPLQNVRHILASFEGGTTDDSGNTTYSDEEKQAAYDELNEIYKTWSSGDATEESFAELAETYSDDTGSTSTGGLYEDIYPGQMVANFNDWCFDESRKPGDTEIIETEYGYHLMYYVGQDELTYRDYLITNDMVSEDLTAWFSALVDAAEYTVGDTSKLRTDLVLSSGS